MKRVKTDGPQPSVQITKGLFVTFGTHPPTVFKAEGSDVDLKLLVKVHAFDGSTGVLKGLRQRILSISIDSNYLLSLLKVGYWIIPPTVLALILLKRSPFLK